MELLKISLLILILIIFTSIKFTHSGPASPGNYILSTYILNDTYFH